MEEGESGTSTQHTTNSCGGLGHRLLSHEKVHSFSLYVARHILSFHITQHLEKAEKHSSEVRTFRQVHQEVEKIAKGSLAVDVEDHFKVGTQANFPAQRGKVYMQSLVVDSSVDVIFGKPWAYDPWSFEALNDRNADEAYRISVGRQLPVWDVRGEVSYGGSSTQLRYALVKHFSEHVNAELSATRGIDAGKSGIPYGVIDEKLAVFWGVRF